MDKFFESTCAVMTWVFAVLELALFVFLLIKYIKTKDTLTLLVSAITFGLFYDAFMGALGVIVDPTKIAFLHLIRYYLHVILIPLLLVIFTKLIKVNKTWTIVLHSVASLLIVVGIIATAISYYIPEVAGGLVRLAADKALTPGWALAFTIILSAAPTVLLVVAGIIIWAKEKTPYVCLSGVLMYVFTLFILF